MTGIEVRGIDLSSIDGASMHGGVRWIDEATVSGTVQDGVLIVEAVFIAGVRINFTSA